jgi:hypothetical protein
MRRALAMIVMAVLAAVAVRAQVQPAMPLDPITAIVDAFRTHDIVALGEGRHNNDQGYAFRLSLIRDRRFASTVNDIVVESGSSTHQAVMDRFTNGEEVPIKELRLAWQDTTVPDGPWDVPMYEEFFRAVRALNASLPPERKLRVLLGDPPFNWGRATREEAIRIGLRRDPFAAELIQREVLAKKRRALVIYGDMHFTRRPYPGGMSLVTRLVTMQARVLNIWTHANAGDLQILQSNVNMWPRPSLAFLTGTTLGQAGLSFYTEAPRGDDTRMEDQFDAMLYLGPPSSITVRRSEIAPELCSDADYLKMRLSRMALMEPPSGTPLPPGIVRPAERLTRYCASVAKR